MRLPGRRHAKQSVSRRMRFNKKPHHAEVTERPPPLLPRSSAKNMKCASILSTMALLTSPFHVTACMGNGSPCNVGSGDATDCTNCCSGEPPEPLISSEWWPTQLVRAHTCMRFCPSLTTASPTGMRWDCLVLKR